MSHMKSPAKKRPRKSLSLSKNRASLTSKVNPSPNKSSSPFILSLFQNAPPAKLSCPLCEEMVPRFSLNKHIDVDCPKAKQENDDVILVDEKPVEPTSSCTRTQLSEKSENIIENDGDTSDVCDHTDVDKKQVSPYFTRNASGTETSTELKTVTIVPLGSLSSKLSKSYQTRSARKAVRADVEQNTCSLDQTESSTKGSCDVAAPCMSEQQLPHTSCDQANELHEKGDRNYFLPSKCENKNGAPEFGKEQECNEIISDGTNVQSCSIETSGKTDYKTERNNEALKHKVDECHVQKAKKETSKISTESCWDPVASTETSEDPSVMSSTEDNSNLFPMEDLLVLDDFLEDFNDTDNDPIKAEDHTTEVPTPELVRQPYYLRNFLMVLQTVMECEEDMSLFNEEDTRTLNAFCQLSAGGQKLYVRLFQRKLNWLKINKIEYSEIGSNLLPFIEELNQNRFLQSDDELHELSEALNLLSAPELKNLAKGFHLSNPSAQKHQLIGEFFKLSKQRSIFNMGKNQSSIATAICKKAKDVAGRAVRVCTKPRAVFSRVLLLFSLTESMEVEEAASGGQSLLSTVLMVNMGRMKFPQYTVNRTTKIFQNRKDLIRYELAMHKLVDIVVTMTNGKWKEAHLLYQSARTDWGQLKNKPALRYHAELPLYLRCFTVGWVYTRILSRGVEILQRLHLYEEAVEVLQTLLSQHIYCPDSRGRWWDRLVLNLHQHLKHTQKAITYILEGLSDPYVRTGHQLSLYQRAVRMRDAPSCKKFHKMLNELPEINVEDVPHVTIKGKMYPQTGMGKSVFIMENLTEEVGEDIALSTVMCSVEELALAHYRDLGYDQGIHGEGSTFFTIYGLLMWDVIFMKGVPDVFRNSYQAFPLDLYTDSFYENRSDAIQSRLQLLYESTSETLHDLMADVWNAHQGEAMALVSWERFSSLQQAQSLVSCLGGQVLSGICRKMSRDISHCKGGLPDLVVWNVQKKIFKLVEVKGPNDRLSHKQIVWLHDLRKMGADAEVCHVVSIGAKSNRLC